MTEQQNVIAESPLSDSQPRVTSSWKEHPIVIAATVAVATTMFVVKVMDEVVIPTRIASLTNQVDALKAEIRTLNDQLANKTAELKSANSMIRAKDSQAREVQSKLYSAQLGSLFIAGNPYPNGLGLVKIGDSITKLAEVFPEKSLDRSHAGDSYISVDKQHTFFKHVIYYFDEESEKKTITHIMFHTGDYFTSSNGSLIQNKLIEAFGAPHTWSKKDHYSWSIQGQPTTILKDDNDSYILINNGWSLAGWPKK